MTRVMAASLPAGIWRLGALLELPRDMYCTHELSPGDVTSGAAAALRCDECRQVIEFMEELRAEDAS